MPRKQQISKDYKKGYMKGVDDLAKLLCIDRRLSRTDWFKNLQKWKREDVEEIPISNLKDKFTLYSEINDIFIKQRMTMDFLSSIHGLTEYNSKIDMNRFIAMRDTFTILYPPDEDSKK